MQKDKGGGADKVSERPKREVLRMPRRRRRRSGREGFGRSGRSMVGRSAPGELNQRRKELKRWMQNDITGSRNNEEKRERGQEEAKRRSPGKSREELVCAGVLGGRESCPKMPS